MRQARVFDTAKVADLALAHEVGDGAHLLAHGRGRVLAVEIEDVDDVGAEPAQRILGRHHDPAARQAAGPAAFLRGREELRRQHPVAAALPDGAADDLLGGAAVVDVRRVDEVAAVVGRRIDNLARLGFRRRAAKHHCAEAEPGHREAGPAELDELHRVSPAALVPAIPPPTKHSAMLPPDM